MLPDRAELEERVREVERALPGRGPAPGLLGRLPAAPDAVEFWQGRPDRLHDREHFLRAGDGSWRVGAALALTLLFRFRQPQIWGVG